MSPFSNADSAHASPQAEGGIARRMVPKAGDIVTRTDEIERLPSRGLTQLPSACG